MAITTTKHSKYSYVQIVKVPRNEIDKIDFALCNQPTEKPASYYKRQAKKPAIITNGGFFAMSTGVTCFGFKDEGVNVVQDSLTGVLVTGNADLSYGKMNSACRDFMAAYPPLVVDSKLASVEVGKEIDYNARRTAIGWNDSYFFVVLVDSPGLAFRALQNIFLELNAKCAINLDGGGSTYAMVEGKKITAQAYERPVDTVMCIYTKEAEPAKKTIYRVQLGAFSVKTNAENFLKKVQSAGFSDAYIKQVGKLFKIQVGAYSVKLNAQRMLDTVKGKGFADAYITTAN